MEWGGDCAVSGVIFLRVFFFWGRKLKGVFFCACRGLKVWRIEKFEVKEWPNEEYGKFFSGK